MAPSDLASGAVEASGPPVPVVLLVEDDDADAFLVAELLDEAGQGVDLRRARTLSGAVDALAFASVDCVLLDLGLPDAQGLPALAAVLAASPRAAVVVLTGHTDGSRGTDAVAAGAQDYLVKGRVDGAGIARAVRYAAQRRRTEDSVRRLYESEVRAEENTRLERGLLPSPLLRTPGRTVVTRYRPGRHQALLGGDFYDVVERSDASLLVLLGDVAGHGPDEAALGVGLRYAWRALVLAGNPLDEVLPAMQRVLHSERQTDEVFATVVMVALDPRRTSARVWLAGHPSPLVVRGGRAVPVPDDRCGPALGLVDGWTWRGTDVPLEPDAAVVLFTDGLVEGHVGEGPVRLGQSGLVGLIETMAPAGAGSREALESLVDALLVEVRRLNGDELSDDVAVVALGVGRPDPGP